MKKLLLILLVIVALGGFGIYKLINSFGKAHELGDAAVATFHADYNAKKADVIHAAAAPDFQKAVPLPQWQQIVLDLHEGRGAWQSGERTGTNMNNDNGNKTLELTYTAKFAKNAGTETFTFDYNGDLPLLLNYKYDPAGTPAPAPAPPANPPAGNTPAEETPPANTPPSNP